MAHIEVDQVRCKGCELCVHTCPKKLISIASTLNQGGYRPAQFDPPQPGQCVGCAVCAEMCPEVAITVYRELSSRSAVPSVKVDAEGG